MEWLLLDGDVWVIEWSFLATAGGHPKARPCRASAHPAGRVGATSLLYTLSLLHTLLVTDRCGGSALGRQ
jgi:hypothetical protein